MMSIKRFFASGMAVALVAATISLSFSTSADAHYRRYYHNHNHAAGAALAAGVIGLAAGAIIAGAASQPRYAPAPPPRHRPRHVGGRFQPWTPAWYNYCTNRYRSFNPRTGYFLAYSGQYKFCR